MAWMRRGGAALAAVLIAGPLVGLDARADDSRKQERRIGEAAAERELYVSELVLFDAKQIALGELALQRSKDAQVRRFARQLVQDHRKHLKSLREWADSQSLEVASVELSTRPEEGVGGSGTAGIAEGYEERIVGVDKHLDQAISDAQKDVNEVREEQGKEFDKAFVSRVVEDQEKGRELLDEGLDTYRGDSAFSLLLNRTDNLAGRHVERGKALEKALD
jgi:predicted outer membrane protein